MVGSALQLVQAVVSLSFLALGVFTVVDWLRHRERSRGYLALALATLGLTSVLGQLNALTGYRVPAVSELTLVVFMASGYALLLFRDSFIRLSRRLRLGALVLVAGTTAFALVVTLPYDPHQQPTALQFAATILLVVVWAACVIEPIVRFWVASRAPAGGCRGLRGDRPHPAGRRIRWRRSRQPAGAMAFRGGGNHCAALALCQLRRAQVAAPFVAPARGG